MWLCDISLNVYIIITVKTCYGILSSSLSQKYESLAIGQGYIMKKYYVLYIYVLIKHF